MPNNKPTYREQLEREHREELSLCHDHLRALAICETIEEGFALLTEKLGDIQWLYAVTHGRLHGQRDPKGKG